VARPFVRILAPRRGEIVADAEALDLPAADQVRPPRPARTPRPRKGEQSPARPRREAGGPPPERLDAPDPVATPESASGSESSPGTAPA
jgi:hypothetical protein